MLDRLQVERERGITVKAQTCSMIYKDHLLNLIDTPGHVDFSFEVSRSIAACDGVILLVAANQGIQAQTIANFRLSLENDLFILPVINKIDLKGADVHKVESQLSNVFGFKKEEIFHVSAKNGIGVLSVLDAVLEQFPSPSGCRSHPFQCVIFDSWFEEFRGAVACIKVLDGVLRKGQKVMSLQGSKMYEVAEVGVLHPTMVPVGALYAGQVGYVIANMKTTLEAKAGELLYEGTRKLENFKTPSFKSVKPTVYAGIFPVDSIHYESLKHAVDRLYLNDPSVEIEPDVSPLLGMGWRIGFLGILHMELYLIVKFPEQVFGARLNQEHDAEVIFAAPNIQFKAIVKDNKTIREKRYGGKSEINLSDPSKFPDPSDIQQFLEPMIKLKMVVPVNYLGSVCRLCTAARGVKGEVNTIDETQLLVEYRLPLAETIVNFFDHLRQITSGLASFDYELDGYAESDLTKLCILVNGKVVDEFSQILPVSMAKERGKLLVSRLKSEIPRQQYEVVIKATYGNSTKAVAQAKIAPLRKDFTQLLKGNFGGGGMERLKKKLGHQSEGKLRLKAIGNIQIPKEVFINIFKNNF
uniref:Translation factor GUF1 homolog, mitochondrial n=1 Tax=Syphacia muris TaxID=451379 RepID=A0A0N5AP75_9BILA